MKVSGFTFVRNAVKYDYPVVESIRSILPVVDEFIVNIGRCEDGTLELIRSIGDPKIEIVESVWDATLRKDPDPVLACPQTSRPASPSGIVSTWTGNGLAMPRS